MENKKNISSNIRNFCIASFLIIIATISFYFCYWTQRPMYAVQNIVIATQTGNVDLFKKHVDLKSIYGDAYDVYTNFLSEKLEASSKQPKWMPKKISGKLAYSLLKAFKSDFTEQATNMTLHSIEQRDKKENTDTETKDFKDEKLPVKLLVRLVEQVAKENKLDDLKAENVFIDEVKDNKANGIVTFKNKNNEEPLRINFVMEKYNNVWKITKITNVKEIISRIKVNPIELEDLL